MTGQLRIPGTFYFIDLDAKIADEKRRRVDVRYHFNGRPIELTPRRYWLDDGARR